MVEKKPIIYEPGHIPHSPHLADHLNGNRQEHHAGIPSVGGFVVLSEDVFLQHKPRRTIDPRHMQSSKEKAEKSIFFIYEETSTHFHAVAVTVGQRRHTLRPGHEYVQIPKAHQEDWITCLETDPIRESFHTELLDAMVERHKPTR